MGMNAGKKIDTVKVPVMLYLIKLGLPERSRIIFNRSKNQLKCFLIRGGFKVWVWGKYASTNF
jgi:hypothetical protein